MAAGSVIGSHALANSAGIVGMPPWAGPAVTLGGLMVAFALAVPAVAVVYWKAPAVEHHPFDAEINHLVDCIREDSESHCGVADAYHTHELCLAIDRSIAGGGAPVKLPLE